MQTKRYAIGVDVGGSHISCKVFDINENILLNQKERHLPIDNMGSMEAILDAFEALIKPALEQLATSELAGVGLAMPGPFDYVKGIGLFSGENAKYVNLNNVDMKEALSQRLNIRPDNIRFVNDATAFAIGEFFSGNLKGSHNSLAITLGTGFGSAFLQNGIPVINDERVPEGGCLWYLPFENGIADDYFSTRGLVERYEAHSNKRVSGVKDIAELYNDDLAAERVFTDFGKQLAAFLSPWFESFQVDRLLIGGNISKAFSLFNEVLNEALLAQGLEVDVVQSQLLEDAAFIGAGALLNDEFYSSISEQLKYM
ncbi:ROK family protein [Carboxylicivirga sediminis]|uniref:ROK family protein n=1 Tax=Carboxylicivirga sediminis TaxID=2006564 RepID=A0A941IYA0_9BACT|nr:ROK family protein [Carboxylicivirga sediminis]MBR8537661.1 ROK family protein [Carboxylicivirga sediminis]